MKKLEIKERDKLLHMAIQKLPDRQRFAFTLAKINGMKQDQIATIMGAIVSSVESLLIRAKKI